MNSQEVSGIYVSKNKHLYIDLDTIINNVIIETKNNRPLINTLEGEIKELNKENEQIAERNKEYHEQVMELKEEIKELKAENEREVFECSHHYNSIKAENDGLAKLVVDLKEEIKELKRDIKHKAIKLNQSHYPKEYKQEASEYFHHNPKCKKLLFFMIEGNEFDEDNDNDGAYDGILYADDCIAEIDNV